jgi:signal transduction histidine kinase
VCLCTGALNCVKQYGSMKVPVIVLNVPLLACIAIRYTQWELVLVELGVVAIVLTLTMLDIGTYVYQYDHTRPDPLYILLTLYSIMLISSSMCAVLCVIMQQRQQAMESIVSLKDDLLFLSSQVSHDIRAPIMHVTDMCSSVKDGTCTESQLQEAQTSCEAIMEMMDSWLLMLRTSELSTTLLHKTAVAVDTAAFLGRVRSYGNRMITLLAKQEVALLVENTLPPCLKFDQRLLYHIIINLVSNAIKYTEQGEVIIAASFDETVDSMTLCVRDTGRGIDKDDVDHIFDRYFRVGAIAAAAAADEHVQNHGVGLSIVRRLTEALDGTVTVQSDLGVGSTFTVCIPAVPAAPPEDAPIDEDIDLSAVRVCLAEDNKSCNKMFARMLDSCAKVTIVEDGAAVLPTLARVSAMFCAWTATCPTCLALRYCKRCTALVGSSTWALFSFQGLRSQPLLLYVSLPVPNLSVVKSSDKLSTQRTQTALVSSFLYVSIRNGRVHTQGCGSCQESEPQAHKRRCSDRSVQCMFCPVSVYTPVQHMAGSGQRKLQ